jgi:hypothetical protein
MIGTGERASTVINASECCCLAASKAPPSSGPRTSRDEPRSPAPGPLPRSATEDRTRCSSLTGYEGPEPGYLFQGTRGGGDRAEHRRSVGGFPVGAGSL